MIGRAAVALCLVAVVLESAAAAATPARSSKPRTIAVVHDVVGALAQSGHRLAWLRGPETCPKAEILDLRTHRRVRVSSRREAACSKYGQLVASGLIAFDGSRVLWQMGSGSNEETQNWVFSAALGDRRTRMLQYDDLWNGDYEREWFPMASASGRLFYYHFCDGEGCPGSGASEVRTIAGHGSRRLFEAPELVGLGVAGGRLAAVDNRCDCGHVGPAWSPDGKRLAWTDWGVGLEVANADGTGRKALADGADPQWSPDGKLIVFSQGGDVAVMNADGSGVHPLTNSGTLAFDHGPTWSPDGKQIAFVRESHDDPYPSDVYRVNADGTNETRLTSDAIEGTGAPRWSPDGKKLLLDRFVGDEKRAYVIDAVTGGDTVLPPPAAWTPAWSPDGTKIVFGTALGASIDVMNADGSGVHVLSQQHSDFENISTDSPAWSSDGSKIAFESSIDDGGGNWVHSYVIVINSDGTGEHRVGEGGAPAWASGTSTLAWGNGVSGDGLVIANADGSGRRQIAANVHYAPVTIHSASTGALVKSFDTPGTAVGLAMSSRYIAGVYRKSESRYELRRYRADGTFLGSASLPKNVDPYLVTVGARVVVYATTLRIFAVDAETGRTTVVAKLRPSSAPPVGLSILNRRVVWAENVKGGARIRALVLNG